MLKINEWRTLGTTDWSFKEAGLLVCGYNEIWLHELWL